MCCRTSLEEVAGATLGSVEAVVMVVAGSVAARRALVSWGVAAWAQVARGMEVRAARVVALSVARSRHNRFLGCIEAQYRRGRRVSLPRHLGSRHSSRKHSYCRTAWAVALGVAEEQEVAACLAET